MLCIGTGWCAQREGHNNPQRSRLQNSPRCKDLPGGGTTVEMLFHNKFCDMFTPWPFGYGRIRPIDFTQPVFYAQQLTDDEVAQFIQLQGII